MMFLKYDMIYKGWNWRRKYKENTFSCKHEDTCLAVHTIMPNKLMELFTCIRVNMHEYSQFVTNISEKALFADSGWIGGFINFCS